MRTGDDECGRPADGTEKQQAGLYDELQMQRNVSGRGHVRHGARAAGSRGVNRGGLRVPVPEDIPAVQITNGQLVRRLP